MQPNKMSVVSITKSNSAVYDQVNFYDMVSKAISNLESEGIKIPSSGKVFVKPNVIMGATAKDSITTEPKFISSLIYLLKDRGVKKIYIGDSPASYMKSSDSFKETGMAEEIKLAGGEFVNIDDSLERVEVNLPNSDMLETISLPKKAIEADYVINFAKLKTHRIAKMTCCVKNWVGLIPQDLRLEYHQTRLPKLVSEVHQLLPESLCFADAVIVGEGEGPDLSTPRFLGALLASNDPVALDAIAAELVNFNVNELPFTLTSFLDGIGEIDRNKIVTVGDNPNELSIKLKRPTIVPYNRFPCNFILGGMCEGCFAWIMGPALFWERDGVWEKISKNVGKPTFMLGFNAKDINFEKHLKEGPYFVIGDCTPKTYQNDPRTIYIKGCCPGPKISEIILKECKVNEESQWL